MLSFFNYSYNEDGIISKMLFSPCFAVWHIHAWDVEGHFFHCLQVTVK